MSEEKNATNFSHGFEHVSLKAYIIGFLLCLLMTATIFTIVGKQLLTGGALLAAILILAVIQLLIQLKCFLHLSSKSSARWNLFTLIFTAFILLFLVIGSMWIMYSLSIKMMIH